MTACSRDPSSTLTDGVSRQFEDEDFLDPVAELSDDPTDDATTSNVADRVGCKYHAAHQRLNQLQDEGRVKSRTVGSTNVLVWYPADA